MPGVDLGTDLPTGSLHWLADRTQEIVELLSNPHVAGIWNDASASDDVYASRAFHSRGHGASSVYAARASNDLSGGDTMTARLMRGGSASVTLDWTAPPGGAATAAKTGSLSARSLIPTLVRIRDLLRRPATNDAARGEDFAAVSAVAASAAPTEANLYLISAAGPWSPASGSCYEQSGRCFRLSDSGVKAISKACGRMLKLEYNNGRYRLMARNTIVTDRAVSPLQAIRAIRKMGSPGPDWWVEAPRP